MTTKTRPAKTFKHSTKFERPPHGIHELACMPKYVDNEELLQRDRGILKRESAADLTARTILLEHLAADIWEFEKIPAYVEYCAGCDKIFDAEWRQPRRRKRDIVCHGGTICSECRRATKTPCQEQYQKDKQSFFRFSQAAARKGISATESQQIAELLIYILKDEAAKGPTYDWLNPVVIGYITDGGVVHGTHVERTLPTDKKSFVFVIRSLLRPVDFRNVLKELNLEDVKEQRNKRLDERGY